MSIFTLKTHTPNLITIVMCSPRVTADFTFCTN